MSLCTITTTITIISLLLLLLVNNINWSMASDSGSAPTDITLEIHLLIEWSESG
jgi:hypothetical protein